MQVPGDAEAALHRLQTKLLDVPAGAKRASREVSGAFLLSTKTHPRLGSKRKQCMVASVSYEHFIRCDA